MQASRTGFFYVWDRGLAFIPAALAFSPFGQLGLQSLVTPLGPAKRGITGCCYCFETGIIFRCVQMPDPAWCPSLAADVSLQSADGLVYFDRTRRRSYASAPQQFKPTRLPAGNTGVISHAGICQPEEPQGVLTI